MRFSPLFITSAAAILVRGADNDTIVGNSTVSLNATDIQILANITANLTAEEYYGAAIPPWDGDGTPGWYYGDYPEYLGNLTLPWLKDGVSTIAFAFPQHTTDTSLITEGLLVP